MLVISVLGGEEITVLTAGTKLDPYSKKPTESSWADADTVKRPVATVAPLEPRPSDEPLQDARNAVTSGWTIYLAPGDPITRRNRVMVRGETYPVQGEPARWDSCTVVQAFRTEG